MMKKHLLITLLAAVLTANSALAIAGSDVSASGVASVSGAEPASWYDKLLSRVMTRPRPPKH